VLFISFALIAAGCCGLLGYYFRPEMTSIDLTSNEGVLKPGASPKAKLPDHCNPPDGALTVVYGTNVSWSTVFPHTIIEMGGLPMLVVDRDSNGFLKITTLRIFDDRDDIIARVDEEGFWVQNTIRRKRPNENTLIVYDHNDDQVLKLQYLNSSFLLIEGILRNKLTSPSFIVITQENMKIMPMNMTMTGNCFGNNRVDITIGGNR
jgi:hypothetical protein